MRTLDRDFNGGRRHEDEIRHVLPAVKHVMDTFEFTYINSATHLEQIIEMTLEPSEVRWKNKTLELGDNVLIHYKNIKS